MLAPASAQINLGSACNFLILATSGITTGASGQFNGNFGEPRTSLTCERHADARHSQESTRLPLPRSPLALECRRYRRRISGSLAPTSLASSAGPAWSPRLPTRTAWQRSLRPTRRPLLAPRTSAIRFLTTRCSRLERVSCFRSGNHRGPADTRFVTCSYRWTRAVVMSAGSSVTLAGGPGSVFIFQMTKLATGAASKVILTGGVTAATIYWVPSSVLGL